MTDTGREKPTKYFVDFENVHGAGLKGVDELTEQDEVVIIYSQAAETFHIEHAIDILKSKARIQFVEADAGTRNAADFQLIVALYANMDDAFDYAIISGDGGFDAAIKMGERMGTPQVRRFGNIAGDEAEPEKPKSRRSRRSRSTRDTAKDAAETAESAVTADEKPEAGSSEASTAKAKAKAKAQTGNAAAGASGDALPETADAASADPAAGQSEAQADDQAGESKSSSSRRRPRRRKRGAGQADEQAGAQGEASRVDEPPAAGDAADSAAATEPKHGDNSVKAADVEEAGPAGKAEAADSTVAAETPQQTPERSGSEAQKTGRAKKPRNGSSNRTSTRKETDDAYARAAEAMRLASESAQAAASASAPAKAPQPEPDTAVSDTVEPAGKDDEAPTGANADKSENKDVTALVKALLDEKGVALTDAQIATVASALDGTGGRQGFYRRIIKIERQQNGRALYRQVREHYSDLMEAVGK